MTITNFIIYIKIGIYVSYISFLQKFLLIFFKKFTKFELIMLLIKLSFRIIVANKH